MASICDITCADKTGWAAALWLVAKDVIKTTNMIGIKCHIFVPLPTGLPLCSRRRLIHIAPALNHAAAAVWKHFRSWLRTMNPQLPPSELVVAHALRADLPAFIADCCGDTNLKEFIEAYCLADAVPVF